MSDHKLSETGSVFTSYPDDTLLRSSFRGHAADLAYLSGKYEQLNLLATFEKYRESKAAAPSFLVREPN